MNANLKIIEKFNSCGYPCEIIKVKSTGILCGYVGITKKHSAFNKSWSNLKQLKVHGDVTYTNHRNNNNKIWWIGMDCGHTELGDIIPDIEPTSIGIPIQNLYATMREIFDDIEDEKLEPEVRDIPFVVKQLKKLARQLKVMSN